MEVARRHSQLSVNTMKTFKYRTVFFSFNFYFFFLVLSSWYFPSIDLHTQYTEMYHLSQILSKAACKTTPSCWNQLIKTVSTILSNPVFIERVRPHASGHMAGGGDGWLLGEGRWQHQTHVCPSKAPRWPWAPQPQCRGLREPDASPLQHLGSTSQTLPGTGWVSHTTKLLCGDSLAKSPHDRWWSWIVPTV